MNLDGVEKSVPLFAYSFEPSRLLPEVSSAIISVCVLHHAMMGSSNAIWTQNRFGDGYV